MSWLGQLRIGVRIAILVALGFIGFAAVLSIYLISEDRVSALGAEAEALNDVRGMAGAVRLGSFDMRRREKDFLLRNDVSYAGQYGSAAEGVDAALVSIEAVPLAAGVADHVASLRKGVAQHRAAFGQVVTAREAMGLDQNKGMQGALRKAVHEVETKVRAKNRFDLMTSMLMMRRHEKDFMLRDEPRYLDELRKERAKFDEIVAKHDMVEEEAKELARLMDVYVAQFAEYVALRHASNEQVRQLSKIFSDMQPSFDALSTFAEEGADRANRAAHAVRGLLEDLDAIYVRRDDGAVFRRQLRARPRHRAAAAGDDGADGQAGRRRYVGGGAGARSPR